MKAGLVILGIVLIGLFAYVETTQVEVTAHQISPAGDFSEAITIIQVSDLHLRSLGAPGTCSDRSSQHSEIRPSGSIRRCDRRRNQSACTRAILGVT
jgi:predicted MPP superfamily phosphohydrolase